MYASLSKIDLSLGLSQMGEEKSEKIDRGKFNLTLIAFSKSL